MNSNSWVAARKGDGVQGMRWSSGFLDNSLRSGTQRFNGNVASKVGNGGYWLAVTKTEKQWKVVEAQIESLVRFSFRVCYLLTCLSVIVA